MTTSTQQDSDIALNWIDGEWVGSDTIVESINPATYDVIGRYADGNEEIAKAAIVAAKRAMRKPTGSMTASYARGFSTSSPMPSSATARN